MDPFTYTPKRAAQILGLTVAQLGQRSKADAFTPVELLALRKKLNRMPERLDKPLRQLFLNLKGGTGKTSLSTSYAFRLAEMGRRVLVVDLDSQGHASKCLGVEGEAHEKTLLEVLVKKAPIADVIVPTGYPQLDLVPSNLRMSAVDLSLISLTGREFKLRSALEQIEGQYDDVVLDAPPSFGLLNLNALMATDELFVPVLADFLSFHGLKLMFDTLADLQESLSLELQGIHIVANAYNQTFKIAREALGALREHYPEYLLKTVVRQCTKFAQASSEGRPVFAFDPESKGAIDIQAVIDEVAERRSAA